jgi:hypothetical protein
VGTGLETLLVSGRFYLGTPDVQAICILKIALIEDVGAETCVNPTGID